MEAKYINGSLSKEVAKKYHEIQVPLRITNEQLENVIVDAFSGAINYWGLTKVVDTEAYQEIKEDICYEEKIFTLLLNNIPVVIVDNEDKNNKWELTLEKLINGVRLNFVNRPHDCDLDNMDASTVDCIIQYALMGDVIYG